MRRVPITVLAIAILVGVHAGSAAQERDPWRGRLQLKFQLDSEGRVQTWSYSPKS